MAIKKIQIKPPDNSYADVLHPETDSTQVLMNGGNTLQIDFDEKLLIKDNMILGV